MKKKMRTIAMGILLAVFLISTALLLRQLADNSGGEVSYKAAQEIAGSTQKKPREEVPAATDNEAQPVPRWVPAAVEDDLHAEEMAAIRFFSL